MRVRGTPFLFKLSTIGEKPAAKMREMKRIAMRSRIIKTNQRAIKTTKTLKILPVEMSIKIRLSLEVSAITLSIAKELVSW